MPSSGVVSGTPAEVSLITPNFDSFRARNRTCAGALIGHRECHHPLCRHQDEKAGSLKSGRSRPAHIVRSSGSLYHGGRNDLWWHGPTGYLASDYALVAQNVTSMTINCLGIYRWLIWNGDGDPFSSRTDPDSISGRSSCAGWSWLRGTPVNGELLHSRATWPGSRRSVC